jgi:hypothetical protein
MTVAMRTLAVLVVVATLVVGDRSEVDAAQLLYGAEGNRLRRFDIDTITSPPLVEDILIERASLDPEGRDINGQICRIPGGGGRFVAGEDTGQPTPPAGWGVFAPDGTQVGKLTATYFVSGAEPYGCAFRGGNLFTSEVGAQGFGANDGQLIMWFPPYDVFPGPPGAYPATNAASTSFCKIDTGLSTAGAVAVDGLGRVYVASSSGLRIDRYSPPLPTGPDAAGGCGRTDGLGSPLADLDRVNKETLAVAPLTYTGLAFAPNGNLYAASIVTGEILEIDVSVTPVVEVRRVLDPPGALPPYATGTPQGLAVDADGTLYYADLDLVGTFPNLGPGPNGKIWRITFDGSNQPQVPQIVKAGLAFPDGLGVLPGDLQGLSVPLMDAPGIVVLVGLLAVAAIVTSRRRPARAGRSIR